MRKQTRKRNHRPTQAAPTPDTTERDGPPPVDSTKVRLAALREIVGILGEEYDGPFMLPPPVETFYQETPEKAFCLLVQSGNDLPSLQIATSYSRGAILAGLVALACGADVSRVHERRVA